MSQPTPNAVIQVLQELQHSIQQSGVEPDEATFVELRV